MSLPNDAMTRDEVEVLLGWLDEGWHFPPAKNKSFAAFVRRLLIELDAGIPDVPAVVERRRDGG